METSNLRTKYTGKKARAGSGGLKKLKKGTIADWKFLEKMEIEEREKEEAVKEKAERARAKEGKRSGVARAVLRAKVCTGWHPNI